MRHRKTIRPRRKVDGRDSRRRISDRIALAIGPADGRWHSGTWSDSMSRATSRSSASVRTRGFMVPLRYAPGWRAWGGELRLTDKVMPSCLETRGQKVSATIHGGEGPETLSHFTHGTADFSLIVRADATDNTHLPVFV